MKIKSLMVTVGLLLILSSSINYIPSVSANENFSLTLLFPSENEKMDSISQFIKQSWSPLFVEIQRDGVTKPVYLSKFAENKWDIALIVFESTRKDAPPIFSTYSPLSSFGKNIFHMNNSDIMISSGVNVSDINQLVTNYQYAQTVEDQIQIAKNIQDKHANKWLLEIPLSSQSNILARWAAIDGFDEKEGLLQSIYLGANWSSNPKERANINRKISEFHYSLNSYTGTINPLYYKTNSDLLLAQTLYSSLLLFDKNGGTHPNLATAYNYQELNNSGSIWNFTIRDDVFWSDGTKLTSKDIKFTFDMNRFEWIGATNYNYWKEVKEIQILNDTTVSIEFNKRTIFDYQTLGKELIIPEHILNRSIALSDGSEVQPYDGIFPGHTKEWSDYNFLPVTAGAYILKGQNLGDTFDVDLNPSYWYPSELDLPYNGVNTKNLPQKPYFFINTNTQNETFMEKVNSLAINSIVFHNGGSENIDKNTENTLFESGRFDFVHYENLPIDDEKLNDKRFTLTPIGIPTSSIHLLFNLKNSNLHNKEVRKALTHGINRSIIAKVLGFGQLPQYTLIPRYYTDYYDDSTALTYNYKKARDIFKNNGLEASDKAEPEINYDNPIDKISIPIYPIVISQLLIVILARKKKKSI